MSTRPTRIDRMHRHRPVERMPLAVLGACLGLLGCSATRGGPGAHPDVVLITVDTLRADHVGCYGDRDASTPVIDALAGDGVRFVSVVAPTPLTLPSHVSLLTGNSPLVHGVRDNAGFVLRPGLSSAAEQFQANGYRTAAFVSGYPLHSRSGLSRGFDHYDDRFTRGGTTARPQPVERRADETVAAVDAWIRSAPNQPERPIFLWVHLFDPHAPYEPPEPFLARFSSRRYDGEIAFTDSQIGVLLGRLDGARPGRPRIVAVTADHGEGLGDHGEATHGLFIYDSTVRIPLILSGADLPIGRTVPALARLIDVAPTLLDVARIPPMASAEGASLRSAMNGESATRPAYTESLFGRLCCGWAPLHGWRDGRWQYIDAPRPELYDLASDSGEHHNLAAAQPHDVSRFAVALSAALARQAPVAPGSTQTADRDRLRSLGYVSGSVEVRPSLRDPKDMVGVSARLGVALELEDREPMRAVREFEHVLHEDPTNPLARRHLAMTLGSQGQLEKAVTLFVSLVNDGDTSAETLDGLGRALMAARRPGEAKLAFERALQRAPDDVDALRSLADLAIERADFADARSKLELAYRTDPGNDDVALKFGIVLLRIGETQPAIEVLTRLVARDPANRDALLDLGGALLRLERYSEAVPYFERAIAAGADSPLAWNGLATAKINTNDRAGAARALRRSLQLEPDQSDARAALKALVP